MRAVATIRGRGAPAYAVTVYTSNVANGGCNVPVSVMLHSELGSSERIDLTVKPGRFQPGRADVFVLARAPDLGPLADITIGHQSARRGRWHLDRVEVLHQPTGQLQAFPCGQWLAATEGDGKVGPRPSPGNDGLSPPVRATFA